MLILLLFIAFSLLKVVERISGINTNLPTFFYRSSIYVELRVAPVYKLFVS